MQDLKFQVEFRIVDDDLPNIPLTINIKTEELFIKFEVANGQIYSVRDYQEFLDNKSQCLIFHDDHGHASISRTIDRVFFRVNKSNSELGIRLTLKDCLPVLQDLVEKRKRLIVNRLIV